VRQYERIPKISFHGGFQHECIIRGPAAVPHSNVCHPPLFRPLTHSNVGIGMKRAGITLLHPHQHDIPARPGCNFCTPPPRVKRASSVAQAPAALPHVPPAHLPPPPPPPSPSPPPPTSRQPPTPSTSWLWLGRGWETNPSGLPTSQP
jgi:hypothetical protein